MEWRICDGNQIHHVCIWRHIGRPAITSTLLQIIIQSPVEQDLLSAKVWHLNSQSQDFPFFFSFLYVSKTLHQTSFGSGLKFFLQKSLEILVLSHIALISFNFLLVFFASVQPESDMSGKSFSSLKDFEDFEGTWWKWSTVFLSDPGKPGVR